MISSNEDEKERQKAGSLMKDFKDDIVYLKRALNHGTIKRGGG